MAAKDLTTPSTASLFGKIREHELEMNRLNEQENEEKHVKSIALKVVAQNCFGCDKQGHIKAECPSNVSKENGGYKKYKKKDKARRAYNDDSSLSSSSKNEEEANMCLMPNENSETISVSSNTSINFDNYSQLLNAFKETHEEANRLTLLNN